MDTELNSLMNQVLAEMQQMNRTLGKTAPGSVGNADQITKQFGTSLEKGMSKVFEKAGRAAEVEAKKAARAAARAKDASAGDVKTAGMKAAAAANLKHINTINAASTALSELGATVTKLGGQLYKGMDGLSGFAHATESAVTTTAKFASTLGGPVAKALSMVAVAAVKYASAAVEQSDKMYKAHKDLNRSGAAASDGLQGVYDMMQQFSLGVDELDKMTGLIAANSQSLAMFKGNVASGARALGKISGEIKDSGLREQFLAMGISMEDQRESAAAYIALQTRIGGVQNRSTKEIAASIGEYVKETDAITKLTGASRKEQEVARNRAMAIEQFRFKQEQAAASGSDAEKKIAKTQLETFNMLSAIGPGGKQLAEGVAAMSTGFITKGPGEALSKLIGTAGTDIMKDATMTAAQKTEAILSLVDKSLKGAQGQQAAFGQFSEVFTGFDYSGLQDALKVGGQFAKRLNEAKTEQERQIVMNEAAAAAQVKGEVANLDTRTALQGMVQMGVLPATEAMAALAKGAKAAAELLPQTAVGKPADARTSVERMIGERNLPGDIKFGTGPKYTGPGPGINPMGTTPGSMDSGPVFGNKAQVTLTGMLDELKKLAQTGGVAGMSAAMTAHDAAHKHEPPTITPEAAKQLGQGVGSPLKNLMVTSGFGMRTDPFTGKQAGHGGVDLAGKIGDAIMAPESGIARVIGEAQSGGYGNMVEILNEQGKVIHRLAHMSETMIKTGDKIAAGVEIGKVGSTGRSTGSHLHWEQFDPTTGKQVDPIAMLAARQGRGAPSGATDMNTYMRTVAMLESGGNANVKAIANGVPSSAGGLYGFLESSWKGLGGTNAQDRFDPAKSTEMMAKFSAQQKTQMEKNLGRQVSGSDLYMAHFLGAGGATNFFKQMGENPMASAAAAMPTAAASNKSIFYNKQGGERSFQDVYQLMTEKYKKQEANVLAGNIPALVAQITGGSGMLAPGGIAGPTGVATPVAAAPGTTAALPAAQVQPTQPQTTQPSTVAQQNSLMLQQLVTLNQQQNTLLGRILQTSQA